VDNNHWLIIDSQMVKYHLRMLSEILHIQLEVLKTLNPATLLLVDSGPLEHDCLEVMEPARSN
jgi:hypothetical protein